MFVTASSFGTHAVGLDVEMFTRVSQRHRLRHPWRTPPWYRYTLCWWEDAGAWQRRARKSEAVGTLFTMKICNVHWQEFMMLHNITA